MKNIFLQNTFISILFLFFITGCTSQSVYTSHPYTTISLKEIERSLPEQTIAVGFDVDDTVLFSSPAFYYVMNNSDGPEGSNKYGSNPFEHDEIWTDINGIYDQFSLPKKIAHKLIDMHQMRGDQIYFITARAKSENEKLSALLKRTFNIQNMHPVLFMGHNSKATPIRRLDIQLYYGDSDSDITEAQDAGIRAIRILRAANSTDPRPLKLGEYGEKILLGSDY